MRNFTSTTLLNDELIQAGVYPHKWVTTPAFSKIVEAGAKCLVYPFILIIEKTQEGFIRYGFNVSVDSPDLHLLLLNEMELIKKFVDYFRVEASGIFEKIKHNSINIAEERGRSFNSNPELPKVQLSPFERIDMLRSFGLFDPSLKNVKFTRRELDCIRMRIEHKTAAETAEILGLSKRTVENYLANIKDKLNCEGPLEWKRKLEQVEIAGLVK